MPSKTDQLIKSISENGAFTSEWPWDPKKPLDSLQWYVVWLSRQAQLMQSVAESDDVDVLTHFCMVLRENRDLMLFLHSFKITDEVILSYPTKGFPKEEKENLFRLYRIWVDDQFALIGDSMDEGKIQKALGAENRQRLRENLTMLEQVIEEGQKKKADIKKEYQSLEDVVKKIISATDLKWKPSDTTAEKLLKELNRQTDAKESELKKLEKQEQQTSVPKGFKGDLQSYRNMVHAQCELLAAQILRLLSFKQELLEHMKMVLEAREESSQVRKKGESLLRATKAEVHDHVQEVAKGKKGLDPLLASSREESKNKMEELYSELNPLLYAISDLNNEILVHENAYKLKPDPELEVLIKQKQARLDAMYDRKDKIFLDIGRLQGRVDTLKTSYQEQLLDERQFEEHAKHQLNLLKTIPRIEQALNIYCSSYKGSFPLFLYVGSFVRGDGDILQSPSLLGKGMDLLLKLPMVGAGLTDIEKCKAFDTGSMTVSLKLGLSVGVDTEGIVAKAGLAVEYNAGLSVADDRTFQTTAEFVLKVGGKIELGEFFKIGLEAEIASWKGGFVFQDHYHWAAWLAARWGHFVARARACEIYMSTANVGPDHRPNQRALAELDRLTARFLNDNEMIQAVYAEIRQYLDYPVVRSKQVGFFEQGTLNLGLLGAELETSGNFRPAEPDMMIVVNENGEAVEYETSYETTQYGGSLSIAGYTLQITYSDTENCPITQNDGKVINVLFSPLPAPELWVQILDIFMGSLTGTGDIKARVLGLFREGVKLAMQKAIATYASKYVLEKTKSMEFNFFITQGAPALQYVRTNVAFGKKFETSVPVWEFVYVDLGAEFNYVRTFNEGLGWHSITYPQYVHHGFMGIPKQKQPMDGKKIYTLRPDAMSGEELWKKYCEAHKNDLWHMFMAIGSGGKDSTIRKELGEFHSKSQVQNLISKCEQKANTGRYKLPGEGLVPYVTGFFENQGLQVVNTLLKHTLVMKNKAGFEEIATDYNSILLAFNEMLEAEYRHIKEDEEKKNKIRFRRVLPPPKTVDEEVGDIFQERDGQLFFDIGWASQLQQETGKVIKSCEKALMDTKNYDLARDVLLTAIIPEKFWVDDKDSAICMACHKTIKAGVFSTNKHHCRICGGIFCEDCCPSRKVPVKISKSKIRVCAPCNLKITASQSGTGPEMPFELPRRPLPKTGAKVLPKPTLTKTEVVPNGKTTVSGQPVQQQSLMGVGKTSELPKPSLMGFKKNEQRAFKPKEIGEGEKPESSQKKPVVSQGKLQKPGPREWYTDDHINFLMNHYLGAQQDTAVVGGIDAHLRGGGTLRENLQDRVEDAFVQGQAQMVVPVNIHGSHWVGVYIHFVNPDYLAPDIIHVDPYGNPPTPDLRNALTGIFPRCTLHVSNTRYQVSTDTINCGPWTVALLEYLAVNHGAQPLAGFIDIGTRRNQDAALM